MDCSDAGGGVDTLGDLGVHRVDAIRKGSGIEVGGTTVRQVVTDDLALNHMVGGARPVILLDAVHIHANVASARTLRNLEGVTVLGLLVTFLRASAKTMDVIGVGVIDHRVSIELTILRNGNDRVLVMATGLVKVAPQVNLLQLVRAAKVDLHVRALIAAVHTKLGIASALGVVVPAVNREAHGAIGTLLCA